MADIEIVYTSEDYCDHDLPDYHMQCHTWCADDMGCKAYMPEDNTFCGPCARAKFIYRQKGWSGKNYEIDEPVEDPYNPHLDYVTVMLGRTLYEYCVKVKLNGKVIFNNYDDEE